MEHNTACIYLISLLRNNVSKSVYINLRHSVFISLFTEIHWLLLNIVITDIEAFVLPVHQCLYACVIGVYRQRLEPWSKCHLYLMTRDLRNCEAPIQQKLLAAHFPSILASPETVSHYALRRAHGFDLQWISRTIVLTILSVVHNVGSIHVAQLAVNLCLRLLLSIQKSDNLTKLAVGGG